MLVGLFVLNVNILLLRSVYLGFFDQFELLFYSSVLMCNLEHLRTMLTNCQSYKNAEIVRLISDLLINLKCCSIDLFLGAT